MFRTILLVCIVIGLGAGVLSCTLFLWTWLVGPPPAGVLWLELFGLAALGVILFRSRLGSGRSVLGSYRVPAILFLLAGGGVGGLFTIQSVNSPHGGWDAWSIWNLHARFLYRGGDRWTDMFAAPFSWAHSDYPSLPSLVASGWTLAGSEGTAIPALVAMMFTLGTVALLVSSVSFFSSAARGFAAGLILLATPVLFLQGSFQMADVPLGFFILLTIVLLYLSDRFENDGLFLGLAGMSAGFAAWTKNEGLLFLVAIVASRLLLGIMRKPLRVLWRELGMFCCGLAPILSIVAAFKMLLSPPNDIVAGAQLTGHLLNPERYIEIGAHFFGGISTFGAVRVSPVIGAAAFGLYVWRRSPGKSSTAQRAAIAALTFTLAGYFLVYLISPFDLEWHLNGSFERLLLHLWPAFVFCIACSGFSVEPAAATTPSVANAWKRRWPNAAIAVVAGIVLVASIGMPHNRQALLEENRPVPESVVAIRIENQPVSVTVNGEQALQSGHARFTQNEPDPRVAGLAFLDFRTSLNLASEAALPASEAVHAGVLPFRFDKGYKTSIAITNPNAVAAKVTFSTEPDRKESFDVPANGQIAAFLDEPPFNVRKSDGTFVFSSSVDIAVSSFLTFQGKDIPFLMANIAVLNSDSRQTQPLQIPYFIRGGNWSTELWLVNPTAGVLSGRHRWYGEMGGLTNDAVYSIPPYTSVIYRTPSARSDVESGRIEILPNAREPAPHATAVLFGANGPQTSLITVHGAAAAADSSLYVESSSLVDTDIAIANPSSRAVRATVGLASAGKTVTIPPGGLIRIPLGDLPQFDKPVRAIIHVVADSQLAVAALRNLASSGGPRLITAYAGDLQTGLFFTQVAAGASFSTQFVLFADSPIPASGLLEFFSGSGEPLKLPLIKQ